MAYFIKSTKNNLINIFLIQSIALDNLSVRYTMKNGMTFKEKFTTESDASSRYSAVKALLLSSGGGSSSEVEALRAQVISLTAQLAEKTNELSAISDKIDEINGEIV